MKYGLDKGRIKHIVEEKILENPDLLYYIDNVYIERLLSQIIEGIGEAIEENNKKLADDLRKSLKKQ